MQNFVGENPQSELVLLSDTEFPRFEISFAGSDAHRDALVVDAESFIAVKGFKARGKRLTTYHVEAINEIESLRRRSEESGTAF